jgi:hypothetical protein
VSVASIRIALLALLVGFASTAVAASPPATVTLLAPGIGTLVEGTPTFRWRIDLAQPLAAGTVTVTHRVGTDVALTQNVTSTSRSCSAANVNCWTSVAPVRSYRGPQYWQVSVAARLGLDRERPRVLAYAGSAARGRKALFVARVADNRGEARMRVDLLYRNQLVFRAMTLLKPVRWGVKQRFDSRAPLARSLYPGAYRLCVTAWDRTGNQTRNCARYVVR